MNNDTAEPSNIHFDSDGIVIDESSIQIIGYNSVEGDLDNAEGVPGVDPNDPGDASDDFDQFDDIEMDNYNATFKQQPIIIGSSRWNNKTGFKVTKDNVTVKNLTIRTWDLGFAAIAVDNLWVENIVVFEIGDNRSTAPSCSGIGMFFTHNAGVRIGGTIKKCVVKNCAGIAFAIDYPITDGFDVQDCGAYCDDNVSDSAATDYYFVLDSSIDNDISNCVAYRYLDNGGQLPRHTGHGFVIKGVERENSATTTGNRISFCETRDLGEAFWFLGSKVSYNHVEDCLATNMEDSDVPVGTDPKYIGQGGAGFSDGAHNNKVLRLDVWNPKYGVTFTHDGREFESVSETAAHENELDHCNFYNCRAGIQLEGIAKTTPDWQPAGNTNGKTVEGNTIKDCFFSGRITASHHGFIEINRETLGVLDAQGNPLYARNQLKDCELSGFDVILFSRGGTSPQVQYSGKFAFDFNNVDISDTVVEY